MLTHEGSLSTLLDLGLFGLVFFLCNTIKQVTFIKMIM